MANCEKLWLNGFRHLIPLAGKAPTVKAWTTFYATLKDARIWDAQNTNVGLRAEAFPGIDCDVMDVTLSLRIRALARDTFGTACPIRIGLAPKWLLVTRLAAGTEPITKRTLMFTRGEEKHSVEILGGVQQYVVEGIHPKTGKPYAWETAGCLKALWHMKAEEVPEVTGELIDWFLKKLEAILLADGWEIEMSTAKTAAPVDPTMLYAPSLDLLQDAVQFTANPKEASREIWVNMAHAIKGAMRPEWPDALGLAIFSEWAQRWPGTVDEAEDARLWDTLSTVRNTGWHNIRQMAEYGGWDSSTAAQTEAQDDFPAVDPQPPSQSEGITFEQVQDESFVADYIIERNHSFFATSGKDWFVWDGMRWCPDKRDVGMTLEEIKHILAQLIVEQFEKTYPQPSEKLKKHWRKMRSAPYAATMLQHMAMDKRTFRTRKQINSDATTYLFCTPEGIVDLRSGKVIPHDPALFITHVTDVSPKVGVPVEWLKFLLSSCDGNETLVAYVRAVLSSALTADVQSRHLWFLTGPTASGKSTLLKHIHRILGSYAGVIPDGALIRGEQTAHASAIASWRDKRFLHGSEIDRGHRWNVSLLKSVTGNEPIAARRLYRDYEEFKVVGKVIISGNETPTLPNVDSAIRERLRLIQFVAPERDLDLDAKIEAEYPEILEWLISGAGLWLDSGYPKCEAVDELTETYFSEEDLVTQFRDRFFFMTGSEKAFVATRAISQLWNQYTTPEQRREYNLKTPHTLVKALIATDPKQLHRDQRHIDGEPLRGIQGMSLLEETDITVEDLL